MLSCMRIKHKNQVLQGLKFPALGTQLGQQHWVGCSVCCTKLCGKGILTWRVKEQWTWRADFIPTTRLLQNKLKKFSHEAYNDKKKGCSLTLLAENLYWPLCHQCRVTWRGSRSCFVPTACGAWIADHSTQWMQLLLPSHSLTRTKSKTVSS